MNWFEHLLGSLEQPEFQLPVEDETLLLPVTTYAKFMAQAHSNSHIGKSGWFASETKHQKIYVHGTISNISNHVTITAADSDLPCYIRFNATGIDMNIVIAYANSIFEKIMIRHSNKHDETKAYFYISDGLYTRCIFIKNCVNSNIDVFDSNLFRDDITKMAIMSHIMDGNYGLLKELLKGEK